MLLPQIVNCNILFLSPASSTHTAAHHTHTLRIRFVSYFFNSVYSAADTASSGGISTFPSLVSFYRVQLSGGKRQTRTKIILAAILYISCVGFIRDCLGAASEQRSVRVERCWSLDAIDHGFNDAEYPLVSDSDSWR